jgi:hypothetical protein
VRQIRESEFYFTTTEHEIEITYDCPPNALMVCIAGPHLIARPSGSGLVVTNLLGQPPVQLVYSSVR